MTDYCLFTIELKEARRIYIRGVADITEPIEEYKKIIQFYDGNTLSNELPKNPYEKDTKDYKLFNKLLYFLKTQFEDLGDELVFAEEKETHHKYLTLEWNLTTQKVIV